MIKIIHDRNIIHIIEGFTTEWSIFFPRLVYISNTVDHYLVMAICILLGNFAVLLGNLRFQTII